MAQQNNTKAFPLEWPAGRARTANRQQSRFGERTLAKAYAALKDEIGRLSAAYVVVSTNVPLKMNGEPYSDPGRVPDPGAAVYFRMKDKPYALSCDRWTSVEDNIYALAKHIEAMRGMERWGAASVEQTFAGFKELSASTEDWRSVLHLGDDATTDDIQRMYKALAMAAHPDRGGTEALMQRLNVARDQALAAKK